jgi:hypothetical protein
MFLLSPHYFTYILPPFIDQSDGSFVSAAKQRTYYIRGATKYTFVIRQSTNETVASARATIRRIRLLQVKFRCRGNHRFPTQCIVCKRELNVIEIE